MTEAKGNEGHSGAMLKETVLHAGTVKFHFSIILRKAPQSLLGRHDSDAKYCEWLSCMVIKATLDVAGYMYEKLFYSKVMLQPTGQSAGCWERLLK